MIKEINIISMYAFAGCFLWAWGSCIINNNDLSVDTNSNFALKELYIELISVDINARAWLGP